jgi:hypothetical protein
MPRPNFIAHFGQNFQARLAEALKGVRGSARLVGAAAKKAHARALRAFGDGERLLARLDAQGPATMATALPPKGDFAGRRGHADHGVFFFASRLTSL